MNISPSYSMCIMCMPAACKSQKRSLDPLGQELQIVQAMSGDLGPENRTQVI